MGLIGGWVIAPLVLALLAAGLGLLVERASGVRLPGALVVPVGFGALVVVAGLLTILDGTAELAAPVCAGGAVAGLALGTAARRIEFGRTALVPLGVALAAYLLYAGPSLLSGQGSVAGYVKLDDSPTWLAMTAHVMDHGLEVDGLAPSSYLRTLESWLGGTYPVGAFLPLGVASELAATDPLAAYQAVIAVCAALLALGLFAAARPLVGTPGRAAAAALVGVQASLFFGYTQWGGIKEAVTAALVPPLVLVALRARDQPRSLLVFALVAGAMLGALGPNGAAFVLPAAVVGLVALLSRGRPTRSTLARSGASIVLLAVAALPALVQIEFVRHTTVGAISSQAELGNLIEPLSLLQGAGLWPVGDFRFEPTPAWAGPALAIVCLLAASVAVMVALRNRRLEVPALLGVTLAATVPGVVVGSPWIDAKALAILSPMVLVAAAAIAFRAAGDGTPGPALAALSALSLALPAGALWSSASIYSDVQIAPRDRLTEAHRIGEQLAGEGPTLVMDPDLYVSRYLTREAEGEGASDLRFRPVSRRDGGQFPHLSSAEVDEVAVPDLWVYRALVRRTSPVTSRPPTAFERTLPGDLWEAWQRPAGAPPPLGRLPLGTADDPTGVPECDGIGALAALDGAARLSAAVRRPPVVAPLDPERVPASWRSDDGVRPSGDGTASLSVRLPGAGRWRVWVSGGVLGRLEVEVDGRDAGWVAHEFGHGSHWLRFAALPLEAGPHTVELRYERDLRAGRGGPPWRIGPVALSPEEEPELVSVPVRRWRDLCDGRRFDWVEALGT